MVVDTSVLLAIVFDEPQSAWAMGHLQVNQDRLRMSTVNLAETLLVIASRAPTRSEDLRNRVLRLPIEYLAPDVRQAMIAADARLQFPLNFGDCFAYALATVQNCSILTLDEDFRRCDRPLLIPPDQ